VFSSAFQFVEVELRGASWASKVASMSAEWLNVDAPESLRKLLSTTIVPFKPLENLKVPAQMSVNGQLAFTRDGLPLRAPISQAELWSIWNGVRREYLRQIPGYGLLIRQDRREEFKRRVADYEATVKDWVANFKEIAASRKAELIDQIVHVVMERASHAPETGTEGIKPDAVRTVLAELLSLMLKSEPGVKIVFKNISSDLIEDEDFIGKVRAILEDKEKDEPWFKSFDAAIVRPSPGPATSNRR
jgi:hypothetical protein